MSDDSVETRSGLRLGALGLIVFVMFAVLLGRLWSLQVLHVEEFEVAAESNHYETLPLRAERGRILDRQGKVLVDNRTSIVITIDPQAIQRDFDVNVSSDSFDLDDEPELARYLARVAADLQSFGLEVDADAVFDRLVDTRFNPLVARPIVEDVPESVEIFIGENPNEYPGLAVDRRSVRVYPYGSIGAHILGYVGAISEAEYASATGRDSEKPYSVDDEIGKAGVERVFETWLRGTPGERVVQVDAQNRVIREIDGESQPPIPGNDLRLTIDIDLQAASERVLEEQLLARRELTDNEGIKFEAPGGAVVIMDPRDGDLWTLASYPTYDPTEFLGGISPERFAELSSEENDAPLFNRTIQGSYAPGSTFKLISAYAALDAAMINGETTFEDEGVYELRDCTGSRCAPTNAGGAQNKNGTIDVERALSVSSDVFFYWIGESFWVEPNLDANAIQNASELFGLGAQSGVALPSESSGEVPTPEEKQEEKERIEAEDPDAFVPGWRAGDNVNLSIGQGDLLVTPLQLTNAYASLANGGTLYQPNIADAVLEIDRVSGDEREVQVFGPREAATIDFPSAIREPLIDGLTGAIAEEGGTAYDLFGGFDLEQWPVAGKTGTAEVANKTDTSVFTAYGPTDTPRFAVTAFLEESGFGADAAGPVVRQLMEFLSGQTDLPTYPTIFEAQDPRGEYDRRWQEEVMDGFEELDPDAADDGSGETDDAGETGPESTRRSQPSSGDAR